MRGDFLIVAIVLECFFAACRTPFAKISRRLLRRRIKRKHPRVSRRHRVGDELNLADKSPSFFRRPEEHERIRRSLGSAAIRLGLARGLPLDTRCSVRCSVGCGGDPDASNGDGLIFQAKLLGHLGLDPRKRGRSEDRRELVFLYQIEHFDGAVRAERK